MVTSPNHPNPYPDGLRQTSTIEVEEGLIVAMNFTAFDLQSLDQHSTCSREYVKITNGDGTTIMEQTCGPFDSRGNYIGVFTGYPPVNIGSSLPAAVTSKSNIVEILFHTDRSLQGKHSGWRLTWRAVTPGA